MRGIDVSNYAGTPTPDALAAICNSMNVRKVTIACQFEQTFTQWAEVCKQVGVAFDAYLYLYNEGSEHWRDAPSRVAQVERVLPWVTRYQTPLLWHDEEDVTGTLPTGEDMYTALQRSFTDIAAGIYSAKYCFDAYGNPQLGRYVRLWDAEYDNDPTIRDVAYGGWMRPTGKQYLGSFTSYGLSFGLDAWEE